MHAEEVVRQFCSRVSLRDPAAIASLLHDDIEFMNVGLDITRGREAVIQRFAEHGGYWDSYPEVFDFRIVNIGCNGQQVFTERVDVMGANGIVAPLPVLGIFELLDGSIHRWRDYADLGMVARLLAGETVTDAEGFPAMAKSTRVR